eukprot:13689201-Alexandrium_andersonii.AAC.1
MAGPEHEESAREAGRAQRPRAHVPVRDADRATAQRRQSAVGSQAYSLGKLVAEGRQRGAGVEAIHQHGVLQG